jgi:hypothetical protein
MDYKTVLEQLQNYRDIMDANRETTKAYYEASTAYTDLLYGNGLTMRGWLFLVQNATQPLTIDDDARVIVAQAKSEDLSKVVDLIPQAQLAYQIKRHRQEKHMT